MISHGLMTPPFLPSSFNKRPFPPNKISLLFLISFSLFPFSSKRKPSSNLSNDLIPNKKPSCNYQKGRCVYDPQLAPLLYGEDCPFHRNAWNCMRNKRENMGRINSWRWVPYQCALPRVDPLHFLGFMRNRRIGFVGDSLNENFLVAFLCTLRAPDEGAKRWKKKVACRGAYFPKYNVTVAYHRAVLLAKYHLTSYR